tara:strand:+ start:2029 stop:2412 length:384 start_codon:yes stop_codon:yes gene_type:complete
MSGFLRMLRDLNVTKQELDNITKRGKVLEFESSIYYKANSDIHNKGVFAAKNILKNDIIGVGSIDTEYKTILGRYTNHSDDNNARFYHLKNNDVVMVAERDIAENSEILINYRDHVLNKIYLNEKRL